MALLTSETRFVAVIVVIVCASLGAASGLESTLNISPFLANAKREVAAATKKEVANATEKEPEKDDATAEVEKTNEENAKAQEEAEIKAAAQQKLEQARLAKSGLANWAQGPLDELHLIWV